MPYRIIETSELDFVIEDWESTLAIKIYFSKNCTSSFHGVEQGSEPITEYTIDRVEDFDTEELIKDTKDDLYESLLSYIH